MATHRIIVLSNPVPGREDEFNDWYTNTHLHEVLSVHGYVAARRFRISDPQVAPNADPSHRYLTIYEVETEDLAAFTAHAAAAREGRPRSELIDRSTLAAWTFTPITERILAPTA